jgi:hypothetical protein
LLWFLESLVHYFEGKQGVSLLSNHVEGFMRFKAFNIKNNFPRSLGLWSLSLNNRLNQTTSSNAAADIDPVKNKRNNKNKIKNC